MQCPAFLLLSQHIEPWPTAARVKAAPRPRSEYLAMQAGHVKHTITQAHLQCAPIQGLHRHRTSCKGLQQRNLHTQSTSELLQQFCHWQAKLSAQDEARDCAALLVSSAQAAPSYEMIWL